MKCKNIDCTELTTGNRTYCSLKCRNYYVNKYLRDYSVLAKSSKIKKNIKIEEYEKSPNFCSICNSKLEYIRKSSRTCSKECFKEHVKINNPSNSLSSEKRKLTNTRIKEAFKLKRVQYTKLCIYCKSQFNTYKSTEVRCSVKCYKNYKKTLNLSKVSNKVIYRRATVFRFSLNSYPNEFDFSLIEKYGWYLAKNYGDNLNGVSRDHKFSVSEGFKLMVNPLILAHPANCELQRHNDNNSKNSKCSITLDELLDKINNWNIKYCENFSIDKIYVTMDDVKKILLS